MCEYKSTIHENEPKTTITIFITRLQLRARFTSETTTNGQYDKRINKQCLLNVHNGLLMRPIRSNYSKKTKIDRRSIFDVTKTPIGITISHYNFYSYHSFHKLL